MSYDVSLLDPVTREVLTLDEPHQMRGGTYQHGGTREAWMNITYNYAPMLLRVMPDGIRALHGMTGGESILILREAIPRLNGDASSDYWAATDGNARRALCSLLALAQMRPDGVWDVE